MNHVAVNTVEMPSEPHQRGTRIKHMASSGWITVASILGGTAVAMGAFGAHMLENKITDKDLRIFQTGVTYQMYHALVLLAIGVLARAEGGACPRISARCILGGTVIFSGTLYGIVLTQQRWLGMITPLGGLLMLVGWTLLALWRPAPAESSSASANLSANHG